MLLCIHIFKNQQALCNSVVECSPSLFVMMGSENVTSSHGTLSSSFLRPPVPGHLPHITLTVLYRQHLITRGNIYMTMKWRRFKFTSRQRRHHIRSAFQLTSSSINAYIKMARPVRKARSSPSAPLRPIKMGITRARKVTSTGMPVCYSLVMPVLTFDSFAY